MNQDPMEGGKGPWTMTSFRLSDVWLSMAGNTAAMCPRETTELWTQKNNLGACSNVFANGIFLKGGPAFLIFKDIEFPFLITGTRPVTNQIMEEDGDCINYTSLAQDPNSVGVALLLAQLLVNTVQLSLYHDDELYGCMFVRDAPSAGGLVAEFSGITNPSAADTNPCPSEGAYYNFNNGVASPFCKHSLDPVMLFASGSSVRGVVDCDCVLNSEGNALTFCDLILIAKGNQCFPTTCKPECPPDMLTWSKSPLGILAKADAILNGFMTFSVCR